MATHGSQKIINRAICWDRIRNEDNGLELDLIVCISLQHCMTMRVFSIAVLHVVEALGVRLPDNHLHILYRFALEILDSAANSH